MKKTENKSIYSSSNPLHKVELRIGDWKKQFDFNYLNTIIAITLNHCTKDKEFLINGYLLTMQSLYLVAKTGKKTIDTIVNEMEQHINLLLQIHPHQLKSNPYDTHFLVEEQNIFYKIQEPLFTLYPFKNDYLVQLITGKKIELPYWDRELENLKSMVRHHPFCSAIDYSGALGPVNVTLLDD